MSSQSRMSPINRDISDESSSTIDEIHLPMPDGRMHTWTNNRILTKAERQADEYELAEEFASSARSGNRQHNCTRIKAKRIQQEEEKKQAIKIERAAKQNALLAQPSKNRGGKNLRKKSARTAFVLDEQTEVSNQVPTELLHTQKPDKVSMKRAIRKPGHGTRGKMLRFSESESTGSSKFKSLEFMIDIYEEESREENMKALD